MHLASPKQARKVPTFCFLASVNSTLNILNSHILPSCKSIAYQQSQRTLEVGWINHASCWLDALYLWVGTPALWLPFSEHFWTSLYIPGPPVQRRTAWSKAKVDFAWFCWILSAPPTPNNVPYRYSHKSFDQYTGFLEWVARPMRFDPICSMYGILTSIYPKNHPVL